MNDCSLKSFIYLLLFFAFTANATLSFAAQKHALIIAIGQYPEEGGWSNLGAMEDAQLVEQALINQGFRSKNIIHLQNQAATKKNILQTISYQLGNKVQEGDVIVIHFSGHGQQVMDDDGDEIDGLDEAIVPYDSPLHFQAGVYEGERLIRDEELGYALLKIRKKAGKKGHLLVLLDACHSGTGTRGNWANARGTDIIMGANIDDIAVLSKNIEANSLTFPLESSNTNLATMVAFFAASPKELNYEMLTKTGQSVGALSYAFSKALNKANKNTSYQDLFETITIEMNANVPNQHPQMEGNSHLSLLGGQTRSQPLFYTINDYLNSRNVVLKGGQLMGLSVGTTIGFFPNGTTDITQIEPVTKGIITYASLVDADVNLDQPINKKSTANLKAYVLQQSFGSLKIRLQLNLTDNSFKSILLQELEKNNAIEVSQQHPDLLLIREHPEEKIKLINRAGHVIRTIDFTANFEICYQQLLESIQDYARVKYLKQLEMEDDFLKGKMMLMPLKSTLSTTPITSFKVGDRFKIKIKNEGQTAFYYSILDIQPDYQINLVVPNLKKNNKTAADYYIQPGETQEVPFTLGVFPPIGTEVFKLIIAEQPIDLYGLEIRKGANSRSVNQSLHPFEALFADTFIATFSDRGGSTSSIPTGSVGIISMVFKIEE